MFRWRQVTDLIWEISDGGALYLLKTPWPQLPPFTKASGGGWQRPSIQPGLPETFTLFTNRSLAEFQQLISESDHATGLAAILSVAPELREHSNLLAGHRFLRPNGRIESFASFLCASNNSIPRIISMVCELAKANGESRKLAVESLNLTGEWSPFSHLDGLASINESHLRERKFGYRGRTIPEAIRIVRGNGGNRYLTDLAEGTYRDATSELQKLPGVGRKLADCICLYGLGFNEAVPVDAHIWNAATRHYFPEWQGTSLTPAKYETVVSFLQDRFGTRAGWAHQLLFVDRLIHWRNANLPISDQNPLTPVKWMGSPGFQG